MNILYIGEDISEKKLYFLLLREVLGIQKYIKNII